MHLHLVFNLKLLENSLRCRNIYTYICDSVWSGIHVRGQIDVHIFLLLCQRNILKHKVSSSIFNNTHTINTMHKHIILEESETEKLPIFIFFPFSQLIFSWHFIIHKMLQHKYPIELGPRSCDKYVSYKGNEFCLLLSTTCFNNYFVKGNHHSYISDWYDYVTRFTCAVFPEVN